MNKKGDISLETVVKLIIALAVLLAIIGIFAFQTKKGSSGIDEVREGATDSAKSGMCIGSDDSYSYKCNSTCTSPATETQNSCMLPNQVCCKIPK
ncbi:hypothetical protein JXM83_06030 [Candidatus Woesearchaeota archaeon]|nr:hypothetical protein [Candidatus Woesearchaeota archaeon]